MQHGDLKIFIMTHQHTEARNHSFTLKNEELLTHVTPLHVLRTNTVPRSPCWRILN